jgi:hypothetical protein
VSEDPGPGPGGGDRHAESRAAAVWRRVTAPARSEQAAFRVVLWAAGIAVTLALVVVLARALG